MDKTLEDLRVMLTAARDIDLKERMKFYNEWAEVYNKDQALMMYTAPEQAVSLLNAHFSGCRQTAEVLDVACGSGLVAKLMATEGYKHFTGVDGSEGMLKEAAKTGLYKDLRLALLGTDPLPAEPDTYDIIIIVGALRLNFVPPTVTWELCKAAKPGGYICMTRVDHGTKDHHEYKVALEKELQLIAEEKLWTCVSVKKMENYMKDVYAKDVQEDTYVTGTVYLYRKNLE